MSEAIVAERSVDYSTKVSHHSSLKMSKLRPQAGSDTVTLNSGGTVQSLWQIPTGSKSINFDQCSLDFEMDVATGTPSDGTSSGVLHCFGLSMIDSVRLYSRETGQQLARLEYFNDYHRGLVGYETKITDLVTNPTSRGATTTAPAERGFNCFSNQSSDFASTGAVIATSCARNGVRPLAVPTVPNVAINEPQYLTANAAGETTLKVKYSVPFSEFMHTILSTDQCIFLGSDVMLEINWANTDRIGFEALADTDMAETALLSGAVTILAPELKLMTETNPDIISALVDRARGGFAMTVPYVKFDSKSLTSVVGNVNHQLNLNRGDGERLLFVANMLYAADNTGILAQDLNNLADAKKLTFQSRMNERPLQDYVVDCSEGEDYEIMKRIAKHSAISTQNVFAFNTIHVDHWRSGDMHQWRDRDRDVDGYDLQTACVYNMDMNVASGSYRHHMFAVTQKQLEVSPVGVSIN